MINEETIRKWWDLFVKDNGFTEVRILGRFQYSGYFSNVDNLINAIKPYADMDDEQVYFVLNTIDNACYGRQQSEKMVKSPKITTNDNDIIRRHWVMCDFDPIRKSGTNSSNDELELAHKRAQDVYRFLRERGFSEPIICVSGNGFHLMYRIDEDNSEANTEIIKGFFKYMSTQFSDDKVDFDEKNFNLARLCKLYGTTAKKGANLSDRPWRESRILYVPKEVQTTPIEKFKELADLLPKEEPKQTPNKPNIQFSNAPFDLRTWLNQHGIVYKEEKQGASTRYTLEWCPWVETHSDRKKWDSALFVDPQGKITFNCHHSHCKDKTWQDVRIKYEPDAYTRQPYTPTMNYVPRAFVPRREFKFKEENPELGKKWLKMGDIGNIDLTSIEGVKTGYVELDRNIVQLNYGEVTLLSGGNASGKSSWLNSLLLNIIDQGVPSALWSGELPERILKSWIQIAAAGRSHLRQSSFGNGKYYVPNNIKEKIDNWMNPLFYLYNNEYGNTWEQLFSDMADLLKAGVRVCILDNLMALDIDLLEGDKNNKQKELILQVKKFAKKHMVHIIMVAHPRKSMAFLRKNDISGTADLTNAVDNVFIMHRVSNDFFRAGAEFFGQAEIQRYQGFGNVLEVAKNRMWGVVDLMVGMHYEAESRRFKNDVNEYIHYGWEREPSQGVMDFGQREGESHVVYTETSEKPYATYNEPSDGLPFAPSTDNDAPF